MLSLRFLLRELSPYVVRTTLVPGRDVCPTQTELLYDQAVLLPDRLYLGHLSASADILAAAEQRPGTIVLLTDAVDTPLPPEPPSGCTMVLFACSLPKLYNTLAAHASQVAAWWRELQALTDNGGGLHATVALTAQLADLPTLLLDQTGRVVAGAGLDKSTYLTSQVSTTGALPASTAEALFPAAGPEGNGFWDVPNTDLRLYGRSFFCDGELMGTVLLEARRQTVDKDLQALCACAADFLCRRLLSRDLERLGSSSRLFQQCWEEIAQQKLTGTADIRAALSHMPYPVDAFVRVGVVTFDGSGDGVPYNYLLTRLREIFPRTNIAVYRKDVVILLSYAQRSFRPSLSHQEQLTALLERYNGYMALSNGTRKLEALSSMFQLARRTATLGRALRNNPQERIFFHEDYSVYSIIDLCVQRYMESKGNDDVLYLIHPAVIHLTRYDLDHHSSLRDVLYYYLINDRNLVKTAAATYMHRNTVINKVNKIMELLDLDLEDGNLRQRLILSCQFIRYYENVMNREFRP